MSKSQTEAKNRMLLSAFDMNTVVHQNPGMWTHPKDQTHRHTDLDYWIELAKLLERGGFDCLFLADVLGVYDVYGGSKDFAIKNAAQFPVCDPVMAISAMAAATKTLCFGSTCSLTYELPYAFARKMTTLDHLTKGRVAWNIVTSYQKSAAVNLGMNDQIPHDQRYDMADEFMEVCYKLWEYSWEDGAIVRDAERGIYTDPKKVRDIGHKGKYFSVPGAHLASPSPQRTPFLFQAGASARGRKFAARHAEAIFLIGTSPEDMRPIVDLIRMEIAETGRDPHSVKILLMITTFVGKTEADAKAKLDTVKKHGSVEAALTLFGGWTGVDVSKADLDAPLEQFQGAGVRSFSDILTRVDSELQWTTRKLGEWLCIGGMSATAVGTPAQVADEMERWMKVADVDGFNVARASAFESMTDFVDMLVPELRRRGLVPKEPLPPMSLRERFGGSAHLSGDHFGSQFRDSADGHASGTAVTFEVKPRKLGLLALMKAKPERADEFRKWLIDCYDIAMAETGTVTWYGFQAGELEFGIFDTFEHENGRQAHLHGGIVKALRAIAPEMLSSPPEVRMVGVLATKASVAPGAEALAA